MFLVITGLHLTCAMIETSLPANMEIPVNRCADSEMSGALIPA
jgi:hypothetical protein